MNAVMREQYEAFVVPNETIETSMGSLRAGLAEVKEDVREVKADIRSLRDKVDRNYETLINKQDLLSRKVDDTRSELIDRMDDVRTELSAKIEQMGSTCSDKTEKVDSSLGARMDQMNSSLIAKIEQGDASLGARIDQLNSSLIATREQLLMMIGQTNVALADLKSLHKAVLWIFGAIVSLAGLVEVALRLGKFFGWF